MRTRAPIVAFTLLALLAGPTQPATAQHGTGIVTGVDAQPLAVHARRVVEALDLLGEPLSADARARLERGIADDDDAVTVREIQAVLDPLCLATVHINPESRVKVAPGRAPRDLVELGWSCYLVKVHNEAGTTAPLAVSSPQALPLAGSPAEAVRDRWLELAMFDARPLMPTLSGVPVEYRIIQVHSRDAGQRAAVIAFDVGQGTQDIGFRNDTTLTFACAPSIPVTLAVKDVDGSPTMASFEIRDRQGRVYPSPAKRLAPDFWFHPQVYRGDGEMIRLPPGTYTVDVARGPEYHRQRRIETVGNEPVEWSFELGRWVDPAARGWWSGDHHIHAAGCAHYTDPSQGVHAPDMFRHIRGEDLKVGANLTWGPCFDYQKKFFTGAVDDVSQYPYLLRYDIEVSGFGSHNAGHLCLLRLRDQMYPGGNSKAHWPTLGMNTLRWAKAQGAVVGTAHSGFGLAISDGAIPSYEVPSYDSIGANEFIVQVTHEVAGPDGSLVPAIDFLATVDTPAPWELNIWYHVMNCGYRPRVSGETDFPCIYGDRVGMGRSYVKLDGPLDYDAWCEGVRAGRSYVSDGLSHLIAFAVEDVEVGTNDSELRLDEPRRITATVAASALLPPRPPDGNPELHGYPAWHLERARLEGTRDVAVELIVNGLPVDVMHLRADGREHELTFEADIERSSWLALRVLHSSHTNPIFVLVGGGADPRVAAQCRVVPRLGRSVLVTEGTLLRPGRDGAGPRRLRARAAGVPARPRSVRNRVDLTSSRRSRLRRRAIASVPRARP